LRKFFQRFVSSICACADPAGNGFSEYFRRYQMIRQNRPGTAPDRQRSRAFTSPLDGNNLHKFSVTDARPRGRRASPTGLKTTARRLNKGLKRFAAKFAAASKDGAGQ
jgi:hypothetical protein